MIHSPQPSRVYLKVDAYLKDVSAGYQYNDLYDISYWSVFLLFHESIISYLLLASAIS